MCAIPPQRQNTPQNLEHARQETESLCVEILSLYARPQEAYGITLGDRWWPSNTVVPYPRRQVTRAAGGISRPDELRADPQTGTKHEPRNN